MDAPTATNIVATLCTCGVVTRGHVVRVPSCPLHGQPQAPTLSREDSARMAWLDDRMQRASTRVWDDLGLSWRHSSLWDAVDEARDAEGA